MKLVINTKHGGFNLSDAAYEKLIEWGMPVRGYVKGQGRTAAEVIYDRAEEPQNDMDATMMRVVGRYWDTWTDKNRAHPLLVRVVEELGPKANGKFAELTVVDIPDGVEYTIEEYDGWEHIAEKHRTWP